MVTINGKQVVFSAMFLMQLDPVLVIAPFPGWNFSFRFTRDDNLDEYELPLKVEGNEFSIAMAFLPLKQKKGHTSDIVECGTLNGGKLYLQLSRQSTDGAMVCNLFLYADNPSPSYAAR